jgi:hypothetical protein
VTNWTREQIAQLLAMDGKRVAVRTTTPVEEPDGEPLGVEVEELPGTFHVPSGEPGWPEHPEAS